MEFRLPELGEGVYEAEFGAWAVNVGDTVKSGQTLAEVITDKAVMEIPSPFNGTITSLPIEPGQQVKVGEVILSYSDGAHSLRSIERAQTPPRAGAKESGKSKELSAGGSNGPSTPDGSQLSERSAAGRSIPRVGAAPSVRFLARKLGMDLSQVHGSGPGGRI